MWQAFDGKPYTREQFKAMVKAIPASKLAWVKYLTVHNTASPSIAQWMGPVSAAQRIKNLQYFYENERGWSAGPHGFIPPSKETVIWGFTPFDTRGVHASCFNGASLGFEMVGDFDTEDFNSGPGALVRDNTIFILAVLYRKLGMRPDNFVKGVSGLHFHIDCGRDNHACPGAKVRVGREAFVQAVLDEMERQEREENPPAPAEVSVAMASAFVIPAADGPAGYDPSAVAPSANPVVVAAQSKSFWAILGSIVMTILGKLSEWVNVVFDSFGAIVNETKEQIDSLELVAGWLRLNWLEMVIWVSILCLIVAAVRHIALKKVATS